jgi:hypothetical protein
MWPSLRVKLSHIRWIAMDTVLSNNYWVGYILGESIRGIDNCVLCGILLEQ